MTQPANKFYNLDGIASHNKKINFICGDRFGGKSTAIQKYVIKKLIKSKCKKQFAIFTRYKDNYKDLCPTYFNNTMLFYQDYCLRYNNGIFYFKKKKSKIEKIAGYVFDLNGATAKKSTSYPFIETIIFEEFLNIDSKYIKRANKPLLEVELFISLYETIARGNGQQVRAVKAFLISNNYYINNPYFNYFELIDKITNNPTKRFYKNNKYNLILEFTHNEATTGIRKKENDGSDFIDLQNEIKIIKNYKPKKIYYQFTDNNKNYINSTFYKNSFYFSNGKNKIVKNAIVITTSEIAKLDYININLFKSFEIAKKIKKLFFANLLYYDNFETYIKVKNFIDNL